MQSAAGVGPTPPPTRPQPSHLHTLFIKNPFSSLYIHHRENKLRELLAPRYVDKMGSPGPISPGRGAPSAAASVDPARFQRKLQELLHATEEWAHMESKSHQALRAEMETWGA